MSSKRSGAMLAATAMAIYSASLMEDTSRLVARGQFDRFVYDARHRWQRQRNRLAVFALVCVGVGFAVYAAKARDDDSVELADAGLDDQQAGAVGGHVAH